MVGNTANVDTYEKSGTANTIMYLYTGVLSCMYISLCVCVCVCDHVYIYVCGLCGYFLVKCTVHV